MCVRSIKKCVTMGHGRRRLRLIIGFHKVSIMHNRKRGSNPITKYGFKKKGFTFNIVARR